MNWLDFFLFVAVFALFMGLVNHVRARHELERMAGIAKRRAAQFSICCPSCGFELRRSCPRCSGPSLELMEE